MSGTGKGPTDRQRELGRRIKVRREAIGLSQEALALAAGVHRTYVTQLENGMRNPSVETTSKLAVALGIDVAELTAGLQSIPGRPGGL